MNHQKWKLLPSVSIFYFYLGVRRQIAVHRSKTCAASWAKVAKLYSQTLFVAQALDWVELRGASGWDGSEDDSDQRRHHDGDDRRPARDRDVVFGEEVHRVRQGQADGDAGDAADERDQDCLGQKLKADFAAGGADRLADSDLADSRGYGRQHDVHDADAADQERDHGAGQQSPGQGS